MTTETVSERDPFLWLNERESSDKEGCGCVLEYSPDPSYYQCPLHASAPALLAALEFAFDRLVDFESGDLGASFTGPDAQYVLSAIRAARGHE